MSTIYNYNPFRISATIPEIVWRLVFPDDAGEFDIERALDGEPARDTEVEWRRMHQENPESFLELINGKLSSARFRLQRAEDKALTASEVQILRDEVVDWEARLRKAVDLNRELKQEAEFLRGNDNGSDTGLMLSHASLSRRSLPEYLLHTVYGWALDHHGIEIKEWARPGTLRPRRQRKYTTKLLNILDAAIEEFCEDYDPDRPPKHDAVVAWIRQTFPQDRELLSKKVTDAMFTIINPGRSKPTSNR